MAGFSRPACAYRNQPATAAAVSVEMTAATAPAIRSRRRPTLRRTRRHVPFLCHGWLVGQRLRLLLALDMHSLDGRSRVVREADDEGLAAEVVNREAYRVIDPWRDGHLPESHLGALRRSFRHAETVCIVGRGACCPATDRSERGDARSSLAVASARQVIGTADTSCC